jgi:hypothetical protein
VTARCPHCHGTGFLPNGADDSEARLRQACEAMSIAVAWDGSVDEAGAAAILNRAPNTLRNWRMTGRPLEFERSGRLIRYRLAELARFIADGKNVDD